MKKFVALILFPFLVIAFGDLTGGYPCKKSFVKWAIVSEEEIIEIKS